MCITAAQTWCKMPLHEMYTGPSSLLQGMWGRNPRIAYLRRWVSLASRERLLQGQLVRPGPESLMDVLHLPAQDHSERCCS